MPTAARRHRQKQARAKAEAAAASVATATAPTAATAAAISPHKNHKSTQTEISKDMVKEIIQLYWMKLEWRGWDIAEQSVQFTINARAATRIENWANTQGQQWAQEDYESDYAYAYDEED